MSSGIRNNIKYLKYDVRNAGKVFIEIKYDKGDIYTIMPLISTFGLAPIDVSIMYTLSNRQVNTDFGKGCLMNYYKKISFIEDSNKYNIDEWDGGYREYYYNPNKSTDYIKSYYCPLNNSILLCKVNENKKYLEYSDCTYIFDSSSNVYPSCIITKSGFKYDFSFYTVNNQQVMTINNNKGKLVKFYSINSYVYTIDIIDTLTETLTYKCKLSYTEDYMLSSIKLLKDGNVNNVIVNNEYSFQQIPIVIFDKINNKKLKLHYNNVNFQTSVIYDERNRCNIINYSNNIVTITKSNGKFSRVYFDDRNNVMYEIDDYGYAVKNTYDSDYLVSSSLPIINNHIIASQTSLVRNGFFEEKSDRLIGWIENTNGTAVAIISDNTEYKSVLGDYVVKLVSSNNNFIFSQEIILTNESSVGGLVDDLLILSFWTKEISSVQSTGSIACSVVVSFYYNNIIQTEKKLDVKWNGGNTPWSFNVFDISPECCYQVIELMFIIHDKNCEYLLDAVQIQAKSFGNTIEYIYDDNYQRYTSSIKEFGNNVFMNYSNDGFLNKITNGTNIISIERDFYGNPLKICTKNDLVIEKIYDNVDEVTNNNILTKCSSKNYYMKTENVYSNTKNSLSSNINESNEEVTVTINELYNELTVLLDQNLVTTRNTYDIFGDIIQMRVLRSDSLQDLYATIEYLYTNKRQIDKIISPNNTTILFNYDESDRLSNICYKTIDDSLILENFSYINNTDYIDEKKLGENGDIIKFYYDEKSNINNVKLKKAGTSTYINLFEYEYDRCDRLCLVIRYENNIAVENTTYTYDVSNNIIKLISEKGSINNEIKYEYDNQNVVILEKEKIINDTKTTIYDYQHNIDKYVGDGLIDLFKEQYNDKKLTCFFNKKDEDIRNIDCKVDAMIYSVKPSLGSNIPVLNDLLNESIYYLAISNDDEGFAYPVKMDKYVNLGVSFMFFTAGSDLSGKYIMSYGNNYNNSFIGVYINNDLNLVVRYVNSNSYETISLMKTSEKIKTGYWNNFAISFKVEKQTNDYKLSINLALNNEIIFYTGLSINNNIKQHHNVYISSVYRTGKVMNVLASNITGIMITDYDNLCNKGIYSYFAFLYNVYFNRKTISTEDNIDAYEAYGTSKYNHDDFLDCEIIPLKSSFNGINGTKPKYLSRRINEKGIKNTYFSYIANKHEFMYIADGGELMYSFPSSSSGFIGMQIIVYQEHFRSYIFESIIGKKIGLFIDENRKINLIIDDDISITTFIVPNGEKVFVGLSYEQNNGICTFKVYKDDYVPYVVTKTLNPFTLSTFSIGHSKNINSINYPLMGYINNLCYTSIPSKATNIISKINIRKTSNEYNEFGLLVRESVEEEGLRLKKTITYKTLDDNQIIPHVSNEIICVNSVIPTTLYNRNYIYGNSADYSADKIQYIKNQNTNYRQYYYDYKNYLTYEVMYNISKTQEYIYDTNGNIVSKILRESDSGMILTNTLFRYEDAIYKDRLTYVNNKRLEYDSNNIGCPIHYGTFVNDTFTTGITYSWNYKQLVSYVDNISMKTINYEYDENGLRVKKIFNSVVHDYYYNKGLLKSEIIGNSRINFDYDETNKIVSFEYIVNNTKEKYYYLKDILGTILGVADSTGNIVVNYEYDAFGKIFSITGTKATTIGVINPFRYKGYYYDEETGLFYCNSRYYNPEWGRFISPDSIDYLDPESINGLNLYAYCGNDPVNYADPSGHFAISALIIGAIIGFSTAYISDVVGNFKDGFEWSDFNTFEDNWMKYIGATLGGAIGGLGTGLFTTIAASGIGNVVEAAFAGNINSFGDVMLQFVIGGALGGVGYGISKGISTYFADKKIFSVLGNLSDNTKVNKRLASAGFKNLKIGRDGFGTVYDTLYKKYGYARLKDGLSYSYDFITGLFI